jgi:predicted RecA/RadA family phage recombinase
MNQLVRDLGGDVGHEDFTLAATLVPGDIVFTGDGKAGVINSSKGGVSGDIVSIITNAIVKVDSASGTTFAVGAKVYFDTATKLAVAAGATKPFLGTAIVAKISGQLQVMVRLNAVKEAAA